MAQKNSKKIIPMHATKRINIMFDSNEEECYKSYLYYAK